MTQVLFVNAPVRLGLSKVVLACLVPPSDLSRSRHPSNARLQHSTRHITCTADAPSRTPIGPLLKNRNNVDGHQETARAALIIASLAWCYIHNDTRLDRHPFPVSIHMCAMSSLLPFPDFASLYIACRQQKGFKSICAYIPLSRVHSTKAGLSVERENLRAACHHV